MCHLCEESSYDGRRSTAAPVAPVAKPAPAPQPRPKADEDRK
jgi:hypothetical protein